MAARSRRAGQALTLLAGATLLMAACVESGSDDEDPEETEEAEEAEEAEDDPAADAPEEIVIGNVIAMSGPNKRRRRVDADTEL